MEALTGVPPLVGENVLETVQKHIDETPIPMSQLQPELEIPAAMEAIVNRGLSKDPDSRFQSAAELKISLEKLKVGDDIPLFAVNTTAIPIGAAASTDEHLTKVPDNFLESETIAASTKFSYKVPLLALLAACLGAGIYLMGGRPVEQNPTIRSAPSTPSAETKLPVKENAVWAKHYRSAVLAFEEEKYDVAEKSLQLAITEARSDSSSSELLQSLRKRQDVLYVQRKFKDADALDPEIMRLTAALESSAVAQTAASEGKPASKSDTKAGAKSNPELPPPKSQDERIANLAMFCHKRGQCGTAIKLLEHSVEVSKRMHGLNSLQTATRIQELASLHMALDENDLAQPLIEQVMEIKAAVARKKKSKH